jgi:hypothetical protein
MEQERRQYTRLAKPLEAHWHGASSGSTCRVADISWGGCFVQTMAVPAIGERTVITFPVGDRAVAVEGAVIYQEKPLGFGMQFDPLTPDQVAVLADLLGAPPA